MPRTGFQRAGSGVHRVWNVGLATHFRVLMFGFRAYSPGQRSACVTATMAVGDLILTETLSTKPVVLTVEGQSKFLAHIGQYRNKRALRMVRRVTPTDRL